MSLLTPARALRSDPRVSGGGYKLLAEVLYAPTFYL
jgi:hypothetical protein